MSTRSNISLVTSSFDDTSSSSSNDSELEQCDHLELSSSSEVLVIHSKRKLSDLFETPKDLELNGSSLFLHHPYSHPPLCCVFSLIDICLMKIQSFLNNGQISVEVVDQSPIWK